MQPSRYRIEYKKSVAKDLRKLPKVALTGLVVRIQALQDNPRPQGSVKLRGSNDLFRLRYGDYRVIYQIAGDVLIITIIKVGHRREVYK